MTTLLTERQHYTYLATPHSHPHKWVRDFRFRVAREITSHMIHKGQHVYSPILHGHDIAEAQQKLDFTYWRNIDLNMISRMDSITIATMQGWRASKGIAGEFAFATREEIEVRYFDSRDIEIAMADKFLTRSEWHHYRIITESIPQEQTLTQSP